MELYKEYLKGNVRSGSIFFEQENKFLCRGGKVTKIDSVLPQKEVEVRFYDIPEDKLEELESDDITQIQLSDIEKWFEGSEFRTITAGLSNNFGASAFFSSSRRFDGKEDFGVVRFFRTKDFPADVIDVEMNQEFFNKYPAVAGHVESLENASIVVNGEWHGIVEKDLDNIVSAWKEEDRKFFGNAYEDEGEVVIISDDPVSVQGSVEVASSYWDDRMWKKYIKENFREEIRRKVFDKSIHSMLEKFRGLVLDILEEIYKIQDRNLDVESFVVLMDDFNDLKKDDRKIDGNNLVGVFDGREFIEDRVAPVTGFE